MMLKLKSKRLLLLVMAFVMMFVISGCGKATIGYFDGERIMKESPQIQTIMTEGNSKLADLQKEAVELEQKKSSMSAEDFQKAQTDQQTKLMAIRQQYSSDIKQKVDAVVAEISKNKKLDSVVDNEGSQKVVIQGGVDITDEIIQKLQ